MSTDRSTSSLPPSPLPDDISKQLTDEFVQVFEQDETAYESVFGRMMLFGSLPEGVSIFDPRVGEIFERVVDRHIERLHVRAIEMKLRLLTHDAADTWPAIRPVGFACSYDVPEPDAFTCEFFFAGPKKVEALLKMQDLRSRTGTVLDKLTEFVEKSILDGLKMGC